MNSQHIPLLSPKPFADFSASEFKEHVRSLFWKPEPKKVAKKPLKPFTFRVNKKGTLCIRFNRKPAWISREELEGIATATGLSQSAVWLKVVTEKGTKVSSLEEEVRIAEAVKEMPF